MLLLLKEFSFIAGIKHFYVKLRSSQIGGQGLGPEYWCPSSCYCWQLSQTSKYISLRCHFIAQFVTNLISDTGWSCQGEIGRRKLKQQSIWSLRPTHRRTSVPIYEIDVIWFDNNNTKLIIQLKCQLANFFELSDIYLKCKIYIVAVFCWYNFCFGKERILLLSVEEQTNCACFSFRWKH